MLGWLHQNELEVLIQCVGVCISPSPEYEKDAHNPVVAKLVKIASAKSIPNTPTEAAGRGASRRRGPEAGAWPRVDGCVNVHLRKSLGPDCSSSISHGLIRGKGEAHTARALLPPRVPPRPPTAHAEVFNSQTPGAMTATHQRLNETLDPPS